MIRVADLDKTAVARQQNAILGMGLLDELAIAPASRGDRGVVSGNAQPPAETDQHFVAEKASFVRPGYGGLIQRHGSRLNRIAFRGIRAR